MSDDLIHYESPETRLRGLEATPPRMLIVEDDVELKTIIVRLAERLDPTVQIDWAMDVDAAVERLVRHDYKLVLTDYFLRGSKRGLSLADSCRLHQPQAAFAMMSSLSVNEVLCLPGASDLRWLRKPFTSEECLGFLGTALA